MWLYKWWIWLCIVGTAAELSQSGTREDKLKMIEDVINHLNLDDDDIPPNSWYIYYCKNELIQPKPFGGQTAGSYPESPHGVHRINLHAVMMVPFPTPYSEYASIAYVEHVGTNRHEGGSIGDMAVL